MKGKAERSSSATDEYDYMKLIYEQFGAVDSVLDYVEELRNRARIVEYCLTGVIRERINDIMFDLLTYGRIDRLRFGIICNRMKMFRGAVVEFFGLVPKDKWLYPTADYVGKIIAYGESDEPE